LSELTGKQRRHLRALGHHLAAVVQIGHEGVTEGVVRQAEEQLEMHELIKIKISENAPEDRQDAAEQLAEKLQAHLAQVLGRTALLYRRRKEKPQIVLPGTRSPPA
jgi:RNA-binding protein